MVQTGAGSAIVTVSRTGSFSGAVSLSVEGAPSGVTVTPSSATVASGATTSTLAIDVSLNVPAGSYPLTIRGQATGQSAQSTTLTLTVVTRPASVSLSRSTAGALSTNAGGPAIAFTVILNRIEFLGAITLEVASGLPTGVTAAFVNSPTAGNSIGVTFAVAANTAPGSYTAELRASGTGISLATLSVPFTVVGPGSLTVAASRSAVSIAQNGSGVTSITVTRTNFTGAVTLAVAGLPAGATGTFGVNPIASNGATLTFAAGPNVVPQLLHHRFGQCTAGGVSGRGGRYADCHGLWVRWEHVHSILRQCRRHTRLARVCKFEFVDACQHRRERHVHVRLSDIRYRHVGEAAGSG